MIVDRTGVKAPVKFGDSRSNRSPDIRLPHFVTNNNDEDDDNDDAGRRTLLPKNVQKPYQTQKVAHTKVNADMELTYVWPRTMDVSQLVIGQTHGCFSQFIRATNRYPNPKSF